MPADYKSHGHKREKKPLPGFVWLFAGLAIGLFVALLVYLDAQPKPDSSFGAAVKKELDKIKPAPEKQDAKKTAPKQEPEFNFYTILPELEVMIPDSETRPPSSKGITTDAGGADDDGKQYILQAGSFRGQEDADRLKATLALLGFEASVQKVIINNEAWHRVRLGPYNSTRELYRNINQLQEHDINAMPMELKQE